MEVEEAGGELKPRAKKGRTGGRRKRHQRQFHVDDLSKVAIGKYARSEPERRVRPNGEKQTEWKLEERETPAIVCERVPFYLYRLYSKHEPRLVCRSVGQ